jgi:cell division protein FtsL
MELQSVFYIIGIIFMGLMLIIMVALAIAVLVIRNKINNIERAISEKLHGVTNVAGKITDLFKAGAQAVNKYK